MIGSYPLWLCRTQDGYVRPVKKIRCRRGHLLEGKNVWWVRQDGLIHRECKLCKKIRQVGRQDGGE